MAPLLSSSSPEICFFLPPWTCQLCPVPRSHLAISLPSVHAAAGLYQVMFSGPLWLSSYPCLQGIPVPIQSVCQDFLSEDTEQSMASVCLNFNSRRSQDAMRQPPLLQGMWTCRPTSRVDVHQLPWTFYFQSLKSDSPDLPCFHMHSLLSSCTAAFGCHKVTLCQLCHSCLHPCPSLPAPLEHHLLKFLLQATFLHPTTFLTMCLP